MDTVSPSSEPEPENTTEKDPEIRSPQLDEGMAETPSPTFSFADATETIETITSMPLKDLANLGKIVEEKAAEWQKFVQKIEADNTFPQMFRKLKWELKIPNAEQFPESIATDILADADAQLDDAFRGYVNQIVKIHHETCQQIRSSVESHINFGLAGIPDEKTAETIEEIKTHIETEATTRREEQAARESAAAQQTKRKEEQQARNAECSARRSHIKTPPSPGVQLSKKQQETANRRVLLPTPEARSRMFTPTRERQSFPRPPPRPRKWISSAPGRNQYQQPINYERPRSRSRVFSSRSGLPQNGNSGDFHRGPRQTTLTQHFSRMQPQREPHPFYGSQRRNYRFQWKKLSGLFLTATLRLFRYQSFLLWFSSEKSIIFTILITCVFKKA